jgi:hypothetical protein
MIGWRIRVALIVRSYTLGRTIPIDLSTEVKILEPLFDASLRSVPNRAYFCSFAGQALLAALIMGRVLQAQESPPPQEASSALTPLSQEQIQKNPAVPCVEPPPLVRWEDYHGKFRKISGMFARKLERKTVHAPHYKPGAVLCTLEAKDKFLLFVHDTIDPVTFIDVAYSAGIDQAENRDPTFGQGGVGYGKRVGAGLAGQASSQFLKDFAYPTIFLEDPRYYRLAYGSKGKRLLHATVHVFIAHREDGTHMFNFSEWLGTSSAVTLSNVYHPGNKRGFSPAAQGVGYSVLDDSAFDILREFWPEIARKLKLPFRGQQSAFSQGLNPPPK